MRVLSFLLVLSACYAHATEIHQKHRVENRPPGLCWWACAESIGKQAEIPSLHKLCDVVQAEYGVSGAGVLEINFWAWFKGFNVQYMHPETIEVMRTRCAENNYVIATLYPWTETSEQAHAIIVLSVSETQYVDTDGKGVQYRDHWVTIFDPNSPEQDWVIPWHQFIRCHKHSHIIMK